MHLSHPHESPADQRARMLESPVEPLIVRLAIPTTISMLITSVYNMADTYFVSQIGTSASGAVGIVYSIMGVIQAIGFMVGVGAGSITSRLLGQDRREEAGRYASSAVFAALVLGIGFSALGLADLKNLIWRLGSTPTIYPHAVDYAFFILLGAPVMILSFTLNNLLRVHGAASVYGSDIALSVYGMMMKVYQIAHSMFVGVSSAVQPINGYNFGAKHFLRVRQTFRTAAAIALVISGVWFLVFQLFPRQIGMLFVSDSPLYLDCAQHCFRLYMAAFFLYGLHLATASFFQGIGRPVPSLAIPLARQGVFLIPLAILLSGRFGLDGALLAAPISDMLTFLLSLLLVRREFAVWRQRDWIET